MDPERNDFVNLIGQIGIDDIFSEYVTRGYQYG